ncbi:Fic family protein [Aurantibacillus circumpalustris]|uniref:Fic family protein n=1 Tax=Aurantibacillus circumpalustris TaxID=3036359 RepID=UPI00295A5CE1|nr:Fic family protein [Aurantibacillus circumpalustris]
MRRIYIYQQLSWPQFNWDYEAILPVLAAVRHKQGKLKGYMEALGFTLRNETSLKNLTQDVLKSTEIEGEALNQQQVRSSIARKLGMDIAGLVASDRQVDGVVEMMLDATRNYKALLDSERLFGWHSELFPLGKSGMHNLTVGRWRNNENGPMQVVSGALGKEKIHFEAPEASCLNKEMKSFIKWFNTENVLDPVIKSAIAHLWFVTIHPFDDGNGRIARAIADMQLARADEDDQRFYSMSAQIRIERTAYYNVLEKTQKGNLDITEWLLWYLNCFSKALNTTDTNLKTVLNKTKFWDKHLQTTINERQRILINKLFEGFTGKLNSSKWAKITKCSADTALRDITDLIAKGILEKEAAGGRSTGYRLIE